MPSFSKQSLDRLATCHFDLQRVLFEAIKYIDFTVICGFRDKAEQDAAYKAGNSKLRWPMSRHNSTPSEAVDVCPYPIDWRDTERFAYLAGVIMTVAGQLGVELTWGGTWTFRDRPHFELKKKTPA